MHKILFRGSKEVGKVFCITALGVTLALAFSFCVAQQVFRMNANDPQVEILEGVSEGLAKGQDPKAFGSINQTDVAKSLSPFVIVFDQDGKVVAGTAVLDNQTPVPPKGVFDVAKAKGENRLTWQPRKGVRLAIIVKPYASKDASGFVLAGKSLKEVENRIENLLKLTGVAWAVSMALVLAAANLVFGKKEEHHTVSI